MNTFRDQLNSYGQKNDPAMSRHGNYADLPNPQRAEEIVNEARQRLAAGGGKANQLPAMIQKVSAEFEQRDEQNASMRDDKGDRYRQPNNIDAYIDRVLQMGGMIGGNNSGGANGGNASAGADGSDDGSDGFVQLPNGEGTPVPEAKPTQDGDDSSDGGLSFGEMAAGLLGAGGVAALARHLYNNYGVKAGQAVDGIKSNIEQTIDDIDGDAPDDTAAMTEDGQRSVTEDKRPRLTGPNKMITDESGGTMTSDEFDNRFAGRDSNTISDTGRVSGNADPAVAAAIEEATELANNGDVRSAVRMLREAGIDIDDNMMRMLAEGSNTFKTLHQRAGQSAGNAARRSMR